MAPVTTPAGVAGAAHEAQRAGLAPLRDPGVLAELRAHTWSASSLELWMSCPAKWFVERMLRPNRLDPDPEPLARGGLAHAALRDVLEGLRERTGSARLTGARLGLARELLLAALVTHERDFPLSARAERVPGNRRRLEADLERYLEYACACESPLEPTYMELQFGFFAEEEVGAADPSGEVAPAGGTGPPGRDGPSGENGPPGGGLPALDLGGGVMLRGRIDRVDVDASGTRAVVYDYKGGSGATPAAKWLTEGKVQLALYMRAVESLLGLEVVGGFYQPLTGVDLRARGALDGDAGIELECVRGDRLGRAEYETLLEDALELARIAAAQAGRGELEARPRTCAFTGGCTYPAICRSGR